MSYYRVHRRTSREAGTAGAGQRPGDDYFARLSKYIPADVLSAYIAGAGIVGTKNLTGEWAAVCFGATILVRILATRDLTAKNSWATVQWMTVIIAAVSFWVWVYAMGGTVLYLTILSDPSLAQTLGQLAVLIWPVIAAYVWRGDP